MFRISEVKVAPGMSMVRLVSVPSAASIRACPLAGAVRFSFEEKRTEKPVWLVVPKMGLPVMPVLKQHVLVGLRVVARRNDDVGARRQGAADNHDCKH